MEMAKKKYADIHSLKDKPTFLDFEQGFVELWTELGREVMEANLGKAGKDRRKKKVQDDVRDSRNKT